MKRNKKGQFKRKAKSVVTILGIIAIGVAVGTSYFSTTTVSATVPETITVEAPSPILDRIADCESGNGKAGTATQFRNGQVLIAINTNGTYDQGVMQINSIHNKQAADLGFNLATEEGNRAYGKWLYQNKGTTDWESSARCWRK